MKQTTETENSLLSINYWRQQLIERSVEAILIVLILMISYWSLTLITCHVDDPTFNKTVSNVEISNIGGLVGAQLSSLCFFLFGYTAYLLPILLSLIHI